MVFDNIDIALRISLVLYVALAMMNIYFQTNIAPYQSIDTMPTEIHGFGFWVVMLICLIAIIVIGLWIAVAWHRFVLLGEAPTGYLPAFKKENVISYFLRGFQIGLILMLTAIIVGVVSGVIFGLFLQPVAAGVLAGFASTVVALVLFYRICPVLPAAALGERLAIGAAFEATKGQSGTIIVLAIIGGFLLLLFQLPTLLGGNPGSVLSLVYSAVIGWFTTMIGASVLTTFYGHFIEGREIG